MVGSVGYGPADTDEEEEGVLLMMDDADSLVRGL